MLEEPFSSGTSPMHRLDPRCKILAAVCSAIPTALMQHMESALAAFAISLLLMGLARPPAGPLMRRMALVNLFMALLWVFLPFSTPGTPLANFGPLTATAEGIRLAALITLKSNAIILTFIALIATSTVTATGSALSSLHVPDKLALLFLFTWRYIHVIAQEYERLCTAAKIRGFIPGTNMHTYRTYANLAAMVLVRSWDRAERVNSAMRLRGFSGTFRTLHEQRLHLPDIATALMLTAPFLICFGYDLILRFGPLTVTP